MGWTVPTENSDPWIDTVNSLYTAIDASVYSEREDINVIIGGGGNISFTASTGVMSWSDTLIFTAPVTGFQWQVEAGSVTLNPGDYCYLRLIRAPQNILTLSMHSGSQIPAGNDGFALGIRIGSRVNFRNGGSIADGQSVPVFETTPGAGAFGSTGQILRFPHVITTNQATNQPTYQVLGDYYFDPVVLAINGTTTHLKFACTGSMTNSYLTGSVQLYDLTASTLVSTLSFMSGTVAPTYVESANLTLPGSPHIYEVRASCSGVLLPADQLTVHWAGLKLDVVFN